MESKTCPKCKETKPTSEFHFKKTENRFNSWCKQCVYGLQKGRWTARKIEAIKLMGEKCCKCGYDKNISALEFHHLEAKDKELQWNKLRQVGWESVIKELQKCIMVCANCHRETHNPQLDKSYEQGNENANGLLNKEYAPMVSTGECPFCHKKVYGTKFCSVECAAIGSRKVMDRPSKEILEKEINEHSMVYLGKKYGVSDNAVRKWAKQYEIIPK